MSAQSLQVAILVFDDVEALDLGGPYEVFTTASRMHQRQHPEAAAPFVGERRCRVWLSYDGARK